MTLLEMKFKHCVAVAEHWRMVAQTEAIRTPDDLSATDEAVKIAGHYLSMAEDLISEIARSRA